MTKLHIKNNEQLVALFPRDKEYFVDCGDSLFLRVRPNGGKSWVRRYRKVDGKRSAVGLGSFPKVQLSEARKENVKVDLLIEAGKDPKIRVVEERVAQLKSSLDTFEKVAREWHRHATLTHEWSPSYSAKILRMLELHAIPALGRYGGHYVTRCALLVMPYLFQRPGQVRFMEWGQLDLEAGVWTCPASIMKRLHVDKLDEESPPHIVPLPRQVIDILSELKQLTGPNGPVFKSMSRRRRRDGRYSQFISENTVNTALRTLGYNTQKEITGHGFRAMARTLLKERLGWDKDVIERHLDHVSDEELGDTYDRTEYVDQRHRMIQEWADYLDDLRDRSGEPGVGGNVVKFRKAG